MPKSSKKGEVETLKIEEPPLPIEIIPPEPRFLTEETLQLWKLWDKEESPRDIAPPQTPVPEYSFENCFHPFPRIFPDFETLEIPYVRDRGVKFCIDYLSVHFGCKDYKFNMLQFWFLDVLTDCIWTAQDNFRLPPAQQKIVLAWILYLINLLRDTERNLSKKTFFTIFKQAILIAAEVIDEGYETVPPPETLFSIIQEDDELVSWSSSSDSDSTGSSVDISEEEIDNASCVDLEIDERRRRFVLPDEVCNCAKYELSEVDSILETPDFSEETLEVEETQEQLEEGEEEEAGEEYEDIEFYQPNLDIPPRFLPLEELEEESVEDETKPPPEKPMCKMTKEKNFEEEEIIDDNEEQCGVYEIPEQFRIRRTSEISKTDKTLSGTIESSTSNIPQLLDNSKTKVQRDSTKSAVVLSSQLFEQYQKKQILKDIASEKIWEQRITDMSHPRKGWIPSRDEMEAFKKENVVTEGEEVVEEEQEEATSDEPEGSEDDEWADMVFQEHTQQIQHDEDALIVNFGVLRAIIELVFKYFYESFQFTLIKMAFQATPEIISQKVNHDWMIPKRIKGELVKPKVEKPKKTKEKKEKGKKDKGKKDKGKKDKSKKDKSKKDKASKKPKKEKKKPPKKLTKEEKAELERQRKEQERIEAELLKIEENKRFMFPLTEAGTDDFYKNIFENWVKVDFTKGKGKGKDKGKGKGKKK